MLNTTDVSNMNEALEQSRTFEAETDEEVRVVMDHATEDSILLKIPFARLFALVAGGGLTLLGLLGIFASLTSHNTLFYLFQVDMINSVLYLVTGLIGLALWRLANDRLALAFVVAVIAVYIFDFTVGNIAYGNAEGASAIHGFTIVGILAFQDLSRITANGLNVTIALIAFLVTMTVGLQQGALASIRRRGQQIRVYYSHTKVPDRRVTQSL